MIKINNACPILSTDEARGIEASLLVDAVAEWSAMETAGRGIAAGILRDFQELKPLPDGPRVLVLVGKGHNGGDALLAAAEIMARHPRSKVLCLLTAKPDAMKALTLRAWESVEGRVQLEMLGSESSVELLKRFDDLSGGKGFDICLDGILGLSFKPPLDERLFNLVQAINDYPQIGLRAAVDMPTGLGEMDSSISFSVDFTYATGSVKKMHLEGGRACGRVRWVDLGFFEQGSAKASNEYFLTDAILNPLRQLRPSMVDKRNFGHLFIVGGSSNMPGALLMSVQAAVRSGVGRVTAFAPQSMAAPHRGQRRTNHDLVGINRLIDLMTRRTPLADKQVGPLFGPLLGHTLRLPQHRLEERKQENNNRRPHITRPEKIKA